MGEVIPFDIISASRVIAKELLNQVTIESEVHIDDFHNVLELSSPTYLRLSGADQNEALEIVATWGRIQRYSPDIVYYSELKKEIKEGS